MAPHHLRNRQVLTITNNSHNVIRLRTTVWVVRQSQNALEDVRIGLIIFRCDNNDRAGGVGIDDFKVDQIQRIACPTDDPRPARFADFLVNLLFHLDFIFRCQNSNTTIGLVLVGNHHFRNNGEHLRRPTENHRMPTLSHNRAPFAQLFKCVCDTRRQKANEGAEGENATRRNGQHSKQKGPRATIIPHRTGVQRTHQRRPCNLQKVTILRINARPHDNEGNRDD